MIQQLGRIIVALLLILFLSGYGYDFLAQWEMSQPGYVAFGILLIAATLWITEAIPIFVTSIFVLFLCLVWLIPVMRHAGLEIENSAFLSQFFSDIILLFLGGFVLSAALHKQQLDRALANFILHRTGSSMPRLILGVMATTAFLSMWFSNTATAAMMLTLVIPIVGELPETDRYRQGLLLAVPFSANIGGLGTPIGSPPNAIAMQYMRQAEIAPDFGTWVLIGLPGVIIMLFVSWIVLLVIFRGQTKSLSGDKQPTRLKRTKAFYLVIGTSAFTICGWMTTSLHGHSSGTVALIPVIILFASGILNVKDLRSLSWDVLLLMGGGLCLGQAISTSGLVHWIIDLLPIQGMTVFTLMAIFGCVACAMSSVMSNTATANLIMPIILGLNITPLSPMMIGVAFACSLAMPLPVSTPPNAMVYSSGQISVRDMIFPGLILTILGIILTFTTGYRWWMVIGLP